MAGIFIFKCPNCGASVEADKLNPDQYRQVKLKATTCKQCGNTDKWDEVVVIKHKPPAATETDQADEQQPPTHRGVYL